MTKEALVNLYRNERKSLGDIAKLYNVSRTAIYKKLKKCGLKQRSKSEARLEGKLKMDRELEEWYKLHKFHLYSGSYETKDLAKYLGVSPRTIQRWLKEKTKPSKEQLVQIKRYLVENETKTSI